MERIDHKDLDFFLIQIQAVCAKEPERKKKEEEWRTFHGFRIWIPDNFSLADKKLVEEIFWSESKPEILFITKERTAGITMQVIEKEIKSAEMMKAQLNNLDSRIVCYDMGETESSVKVHWIEYKSFAGDERIYNMLFFFQIKDRNILGTFYCLFREYDKWKPFIWDMMRSIEENTDEGI